MNIRWLASFPKSGNTWVRVFLANLLAPQGRPLTLAEVNLMPFYTDALPPSDPRKVYFGKAHKAYNEELHDTLPAVYIVRDPVDIVPSAANFFGVTLDRMSKEVAKDWPRHIQSWWGHIGLVLKYENMPGNFHILCQHFKDLPDDFERVITAAAHSDFKKLRADEAEHGFAEASEKGGAFFRYGFPGQGREVMTDAQVQRVIHGAGEVYPALGYPEKPVYVRETYEVPGSADTFDGVLEKSMRKM